jgi:hypothetical protein
MWIVQKQINKKQPGMVSTLTLIQEAVGVYDFRNFEHV